MLALTLIQPWGHALAFLHKDVENRGWRPPRSVLGERMAFHAGKKCSREDIATLRALGYELPDHLVESAIIATAIIAGWVKSEREHSGTLSEQEIGAVLGSRWRVEGAIAWVPHDVQPLETPISCKGAQGLWRVPEEIESQLPAQARAARDAVACAGRAGVFRATDATDAAAFLPVPQRRVCVTTASRPAPTPAHNQAAPDPRQLRLF